MSHEAEIIAIALTVVVHVLGAAVLVWAMLGDGDERPDWRSLWPRDDRGDDPPPPDPPDPRPAPSGSGLPLPPDAVPANVRLREAGRLADTRPRPARRPVHPPAEPNRTPQRG